MTTAKKKIKNQTSFFKKEQGDVFIHCYTEDFVKNNLKQGWKVHIYSNEQKFDSILKIINDACIKNLWSFKYVKNRDLLLKQLDIGFDFASSGKIFTIYAENDEQLINIVTKLYKKLKSYGFFKIIGDKNYKNSIINYRYGNFLATRDYFISKDGKTKIYDLKTNYLPKNSGYIDPFIKEKERVSKKIILNNQYLFLKAISFSNYGGIYLCKNLENNHKYILKESRFNDKNSNFLSSTLRDNEAKYNFDKPNFIKSFRINNSIFYVFDFINGLNLLELSYKINFYANEWSKLKFEKIIDLTKKRIEFYHNKGYCLNDVKADNFVYYKQQVYYVDKETINPVDDSNKKVYLNEKIIFFNEKIYMSNAIQRDWMSFASIIFDFLGINTSIYKYLKNKNIFWRYCEILFLYSKCNLNIFTFIMKIFDSQYKHSNNVCINENFYIQEWEKLKEHVKDLKKPYICIIPNSESKIETIILNIIYSYLYSNILNFEWINWDDFVDIFVKEDSKLNINELFLLIWDGIIHSNWLIAKKYLKILEEKYLKIDEKNSLAFLRHNNKYLIPYITNGYLGYIAILIVIYKYNVLEINNILPKLEVAYNVLKQYKNISQKTTWNFGYSGIAFFIYILGNLLNKKDWWFEGIKKLSVISLLFDQNLLYTQSGAVTNDFLFGLGMVLNTIDLFVESEKKNEK